MPSLVHWNQLQLQSSQTSKVRIHQAVSLWSKLDDDDDASQSSLLTITYIVDLNDLTYKTNPSFLLWIIELEQAATEMLAQ